MEARADSGQRISFVIERGAGRVLVAGEAIPLPPKEFRLLLELADAPGEARPAADLIEEVWGPDSQMAASDVYWLVWKLRQRIGDDERPRKILANRKGHGYLIDPAVAELAVIDVLPEGPSSAGSRLDFPAAERSSSTGPSDDEETDFVPTGADSRLEAGAFDPVAPVTSGGKDAASPGGPDNHLGPHGLPLPPPPQDSRRTARRRRLVAAVLVVAAGAAGAAARSISTDRTGSPPERRHTAVETAEPKRVDPPEPRRPRRTEPKPDKGPAKTRRPSGGGGAVVAAAPPATMAPSSGSRTNTTVEAQPRPQVKRAPKTRPPELPPPPTRYLYHLYNSKNGDHFVTTDGAAVTEHEAKGYEGGAIGRVYVTPERATKAIALNKGSAFVFADAAPKTDPASTTLPLWLAKSEGDFFYTTSESEASQDGWSATLIGYVRTP